MYAPALVPASEGLSLMNFLKLWAGNPPAELIRWNHEAGKQTLIKVTS